MAGQGPKVARTAFWRTSDGVLAARVPGSLARKDTRPAASTHRAAWPLSAQRSMSRERSTRWRTAGLHAMRTGRRCGQAAGADTPRWIRPSAASLRQGDPRGLACAQARAQCSQPGRSLPPGLRQRSTRHALSLSRPNEDVIRLGEETLAEQAETRACPSLGPEGLLPASWSHKHGAWGLGEAKRMSRNLSLLLRTLAQCGSLRARLAPCCAVPCRAGRQCCCRGARVHARLNGEHEA